MAQIREIARILSDADDRRIDFVVVPLLIGMRISGKRAGAQPNNGNRFRTLVGFKCFEDLSDRALVMEVGSG